MLNRALFSKLMEKGEKKNGNAWRKKGMVKKKIKKIKPKKKMVKKYGK